LIISLTMLGMLMGGGAVALWNTLTGIDKDQIPETSLLERIEKSKTKTYPFIPITAAAVAKFEKDPAQLKKLFDDIEAGLDYWDHSGKAPL